MMLQIRFENRNIAHLGCSLINSLNSHIAMFNILCFFSIPGLLELCQVFWFFTPHFISEMFPLVFGLFMPLFAMTPGKILLSLQNKLSVVFWAQVTARAMASVWDSASAPEKSFQPCQIHDDWSKATSEEEDLSPHL